MAAETFPLEQGHIMMFARSIGDGNPLYVDINEARINNYDHVVAPPTFMMASDHYDPINPRRPDPSRKWFGSGREAVSDNNSTQQHQGGGSGFHAEQRFDYFRHPVAGEILSVKHKDGNCWQKEGAQGGRLHFSEEISEYYDAQGKLVIRATWVNVGTEKHVGGRGSDTDAAVKRREDKVSTLVSETAEVATDSQWKIGDIFHQCVVEDLKRSQIVMYAGASGDFHPMHTDSVYAQAMGMEGVFAHGMLSMGLTGKAITDTFGLAGLKRYSARFRQPVFPGDDLTTTLEIIDIDESEGVFLLKASVVTKNQNDQVILTGEVDISKVT